MSVHPIAAELARQAPQVRFVTLELLKRSPHGIHTLLLCPINEPDAMQLNLSAHGDSVVPMPVGDMRSLVMPGAAGAVLSPGTYGLAPCICCAGHNRWRFAFPIIYYDGATEEQELRLLAGIATRHVMSNFEDYCLYDLQALIEMTEG